MLGWGEAVALPDGAELGVAGSGLGLGLGLGVGVGLGVGLGLGVGAASEGVPLGVPLGVSPTVSSVGPLDGEAGSLDPRLEDSVGEGAGAGVVGTAFGDDGADVVSWLVRSVSTVGRAPSATRA
jgi:hypothetical protein